MYHVLLNDIKWSIYHLHNQWCKLLQPPLEISPRHPIGNISQHGNELYPKRTGDLRRSQGIDRCFGDVNILVMHIGDIHIVNDLEDNSRVEPEWRDSQNSNPKNDIRSTTYRRICCAIESGSFRSLCRNKRHCCS